MARKLFTNLPVRDLSRSIEFFKKLGFEFNAQFTDENATCMIVNEEAYIMLLVEPYFKTFTKRDLCDTTSRNEAIIAFSVDSRAEVDDIAKRAAEAGAKPAMDPVDHGFMYTRSFYDLDGHHWEVFWMDPSVPQQQQ
jgi:predicted lactoylglutathione lyase